MFGGTAERDINVKVQHVNEIGFELNTVLCLVLLLDVEKC